MGIPIGWNIKRDKPREKDVLRADVTGQRSPIRRRLREIRSPRFAEHPGIDNNTLISDPRVVSRPAPRRARLRDGHAPLLPPPVPEVSRPDHRSTAAARNPPRLQREESSMRRQREFDPFPGLRRVVERRAALEPENTLPPLTPNFAPAAAARPPAIESRREERVSSRPDSRSLYRSSELSRATWSPSPASSRPASRGADHIEPADDIQDSSDNAVGFPPLRRMGRRTIVDGPLPSSSLRESWSPVSTIDGLGDRERSMSPAGEQLSWDTFLSTVVPDPVAPTAESSFASAAASASFSNSHPSSRAGSSHNSATSSRTHLTIPSRQHSPPPAVDQFMRACDTSEDDGASDTEEEDSNAQPTRVDRLRNDYWRASANPVTSRRRSRPSYFSDEPPLRESDRYSRRVLERSRDASAYVRRFYEGETMQRETSRSSVSSPRRPSRDSEGRSMRSRTFQLDGPLDDPVDDENPSLENAPLSALDSHVRDAQMLRDAQSLLERLTRREDISDDFWASVGLTRSFADRVESLQEREQL